MLPTVQVVPSTRRQKSSTRALNWSGRFLEGLVGLAGQDHELGAGDLLGHRLAVAGRGDDVQLAGHVGGGDPELPKDGGARPVEVLAPAPAFTASGDDIERMMYGWSITHCLPASMERRAPRARPYQAAPSS
jgi:hypothetical protein